jgi:hypothetical protein
MFKMWSHDRKKGCTIVNELDVAAVGIVCITLVILGFEWMITKIVCNIGWSKTEKEVKKK